MKIKFNSDEMAEILNVLAKCVPSKAAMPVLECINITRIGAERALISATNGTDQVSKTLYCDCDITGSVHINLKALQTLCANNAKSTVRMELETGKYTATTLTGVCSGTYMTGADVELPFMLPAKEDDYESVSIEVSGKSFLKAVNEVAFARATDEVRPMMTAIYLDGSQGGRAKVVATDGRVIMAKDITTYDNDDKASFALSRSCIEVVKAMCGERFSVRTMTSEYVEITSNGFSFVHRPLEGRYPNYKAVFPNRENWHKVTCSSAALIAALKRVKYYGNASSGLVKLAFSGNTLTISGRDLDRATSYEENIPANTNVAEPVVIGACGAFALNILNYLACDKIVLYVSDPSLPIVFEGADEDLATLLMPMKLEDEPKEETKADEPEDEPNEDEDIEDDDEDNEEIAI